MSNYIFPRRELQRAIFRLSVHLSSEQLAALVEKLNRKGEKRVPTMWELTMLDALSRDAPIRHEVELPNGKKPDFELTTPEGLSIYGDVTAISDAGLDELNPVDVIGPELARIAQKHGLNLNGFRYEVRGERKGPFGDARMVLNLPKRGPFLALLRRVATPWVKGIADKGELTGRLDYNRPEAKFTLMYDESQRYAGGSHLSYDVAASRDKNPLFAALKSKVDQLREAPPDSIRIIIACDGGCTLLSQSDSHQAQGNFSARQVAQDFLRQNGSVDFVFLVTVVSPQRGPISSHIYQCKFDLVRPPVGAQSDRVTPESFSLVEAFMARVAANLPQPVQSPANAVLRCREQGFGWGEIGGYKLNGNKVSISSRALQQLLAGEITSERFLDIHRWPTGSSDNPFLRMSRRGLMIASITVEHGGDSDDDWIQFTFGLPDAAAGQFLTGPATSHIDPTDTEEVLSD